jgi:hypothetical protein
MRGGCLKDGEEGRRIFKSKYYRGEISDPEKGYDYHVVVYFDNLEDYNRFLNWWVLGQPPESDAPQPYGDYVCPSCGTRVEDREYHNPKCSEEK